MKWQPAHVTMIFAMIMVIGNDEERSFADAIYHKYHRNMLGVCYNVLRNEEDAEDALSDAFEDVVRNIDKVKATPKNKLPALLYTYAFNAAVTLYRRNQTRQKLFIPVEPSDIPTALSDSAADPEQLVLDKALVEAVFHMIDEEFPPNLKAVALLKWYFNYRTPEIAEILHISETAVNTQIHRARKRLEKLLDERNS